MLKADFHAHTKEDKDEGNNICYSAKELIEHYAKLGYDVVVITNHDNVFYNKKIADFAKKKGILLIPGVEATIEKRHVLVLNTRKVPKSFKELEKIKGKSNVVIVPHAFYPRYKCFSVKKILKHKDLFDGFEYSHFYCGKYSNILNNKMIGLVKKLKKPVIGTSDAHILDQIGHTYTLIDSEKDTESVISAIKKNKLKLISRPIPYSVLLKVLARMLYVKFLKLKQKVYKSK
ncbi:PHP domain-containing protein [Candidatus Woesearchaeota archaeon]|nr:PHP domain-containing protein [Candidatus Woesearchaeota archaeon]